MGIVQPQEIGTKAVVVNGRVVTVRVFESLEQCRRRLGLEIEEDAWPVRLRGSWIRRRNPTGPLAELWR